MTVDEIMKQLEEFGNESTKKTLMKHGAQEPFYGVKVGDMKKIVKKVKKNHELSLELYKTGNSDAMYLAGLIADEQKITMDDLQNWAEEAYWYYLSEYTVAWVASESPHAMELGLKWIKSDEERIAAAGWSTIANYISITPDEDLDLDKISQMMDEVAEDIHDSQNRVRYTKNQFIICCGGYVSALTTKAMEIGEKIGKVSVDVGNTACKVPLAAPYIQKMKDKGRLGRKRKMARC